MYLNQNSGYGQAMLANLIQATPGRVFFVYNEDDNNKDEIATLFQTDQSGKVRSFSSLETAYEAVESDKNDVIILNSQNTHTLSAMLTVAKNRVHFVGLDALLGVHRSFGQGAKVSMGVTTAATDIAAVKNTGIRNSFRGIKFISNNTVAESLYGVIDGGEYTYMEDCEVYKSTDMDVTGASDFVCNADSPRYVNCTFGSLATARSGAVIRPVVLFTKELAGTGKVTRDAQFEKCNFWINAANTANRFAYGANATDIERLLLIEECRFINNGISAALPAQNIAFGASLTSGKVLLNRCTSVNASTAMSTTTGVFVDGAAPTAGTSGISVQAS